jgi:hypothetical protein
MGKGSGRRVEDVKKIESNPFWQNTTFAKKQKEKENGRDVTDSAKPEKTKK